MRPEDETPDRPDDGADAPEPGAPGSEPKPATWAGRRRTEAEREQAAEAAEGQEADESARAEDPEGDEEPEAPAAADEVEEPEGDEEQAPEGEEEPVPEQAEEGEGPAEPGATAEADTLVLADREEAEQAALAGLRARTAEHEAKRETPAPDEGEAGAPKAESGSEAAGQTPREAAAVATAADDGGKAPRAKRVWPRFLAASFVIVSSMAAATAISALVFLADFAEGLGGIPGVSERLDAVDGGDPQTILILGSDKRPDEDKGRSDTTILLRVDPDKNVLNLLSIPRDLKVNIPGYGTAKFNEAYTVDGPPKTLQTVQQLTGLEINHVVNINFNGFADAVNAIGCVFIDVDRQYYVPESLNYSAIDPPIEPGYQKMCGFKALQYVRYRLDDTDLVRSARQQDFVREARQKISPARLVLDPDYRFKLLEVFKEYTTSDDALKDPTEVLKLMRTFLGARNAALNEVHFPADLGDAGDIYVTASDEAIKKTVGEFLATEGTPGPRQGGDDEGEDEGGGEDGDRGKGGNKPDKPEPDPEPEPDGPAMIDSSALGKQYAEQIASAKRNDGKPFVRFPIFYPSRLTEGSTIDETSRALTIDGPSKYFGYKFVVPFQPPNTSYMEYYGVSGTNWDDPPILENPSETREIDGREYILFYDGDRLRLVGFKRDGKSYWVHNTLLQTLSEEEMLSVATGLRELDR